MATDDPTDLTLPDVEPGELGFFTEDDLKKRYIAACFTLEEIFTDVGLPEVFCEEHFINFVSECVHAVMQSLGVVHFGMEPDEIAAAFSELQETKSVDLEME